MEQGLWFLYVIVVHPTGKIWAECKDIWSQDIREYLSEPWNLLDFGILAVFVTSFIARLMAFWHAYSAQCYVDKRYNDLSNIILPLEIQYFQLGECGVQNQTFCLLIDIDRNVFIYAVNGVRVFPSHLQNIPCYFVQARVWYFIWRGVLRPYIL